MENFHLSSNDIVISWYQICELGTRFECYEWAVEEYHSYIAKLIFDLLYFILLSSVQRENNFTKKY